LYAWDLRADEPLERVTSRIWDDLAVNADERRVAGPLIRLLSQRREEIDGDLTDVTTNWRLERLAVVDRCILRLAGAELLQGTTPPRVVIQEAVHLAARSGSGTRGTHVNAALD